MNSQTRFLNVETNVQALMCMQESLSLLRTHKTKYIVLFLTVFVVMSQQNLTGTEYQHLFISAQQFLGFNYFTPTPPWSVIV